MALMTSFFDMTFPEQGRRTQGCEFVLRYMLKPPTRVEQETWGSQALLTLGVVHEDQRLLFEGRKRYGIALLVFISHMNRTSDQALLVAAMTILNCELYTVLCNGLHAFSLHVQGVSRIIEGIRREGNTLAPGHLHQWRHRTLMYSLVQRCPVVNQEMWTMCSEAALANPRADKLVSLALKLPGLLRTLHLARIEPLQQSRVSTTTSRAQIMVLDRELGEWLCEFEKADKHAVSARDQGNDCNDQQASSTSTMLSEDVGLLSHRDATFYGFYWICRLLCTQALLDASSVQNEARQLLASRADQLAHLLLLVGPRLFETAGGRLNEMISVRAPLHFAIERFQRAENDEMLDWCRIVETKYRARLACFDWDALLPSSLNPVHWLV